MQLFPNYTQKHVITYTNALILSVTVINNNCPLQTPAPRSQGALYSQITSLAHSLRMQSYTSDLD